jgi:hypothetical protein
MRCMVVYMCISRRTGMVVIPLLAALYDMSTADATRYVNWSASNFREDDRVYPGHLPETPEQENTVRELEGFVRKHKR